MTIADRYIEILDLCKSDKYDPFLADMELRCLEKIGILLRYNHNHDPHTGRFTSGNGVDNGGGSGIIKENTFHCYGDYMRETMGSAKENNPEELKEIMDSVKSAGGKFVLLSDSNKMVCNVRKGEPGEILIDENASLAAVKHEYRHFKDDMDNGNPGILYYLSDRDKFFNYEKRGYEEELFYARQYNNIDAEKKILNEIEKRRKEIYE